MRASRLLLKSSMIRGRNGYIPQVRGCYPRGARSSIFSLLLTTSLILFKHVISSSPPNTSRADREIANTGSKGNSSIYLPILSPGMTNSDNVACKYAVSIYLFTLSLWFLEVERFD